MFFTLNLKCKYAKLPADSETLIKYISGMQFEILRVPIILKSYLRIYRQFVLQLQSLRVEYFKNLDNANQKSD